MPAPSGTIPFVRPLVCALLFLSAFTLVQAQKRDGAYKAPGATTAVPWSINEFHTLIWGGQTYIPYGIRVDGNAASIQEAKAAGISDVEVDLPANGNGWDESFEALKAFNMRYLVRLSSLTPMAKGFAVDPQGYRISDVTKSRHFEISLPGATSALVVLASKGDSAVQKSARLPVIDGKLTYDLKTALEIDCVLLVFPQMTSAEQPDYWEGMDAHRDDLLSSLMHHSPGAGLRGIVNPIGKTVALPGKQLQFVPATDGFRTDLRNLLEERYKNMETAQRSWAMSGSIMSSSDDESKKPLSKFEDLARLVPLWSGNRGISYLWDPKTDALLACESRRSAVWQDIADVVNAASDRRFRRIVTAIRSVCDVPVIQEWAGWSAPYEVRDPAIDGVGIRATGTSPSALLETGSRAASSILRWSLPGWSVATDIDLGSAPESAAQLPNVLDDLGSLGARGFFIRTDATAVAKTVGAEAAKRTADTGLSTSAPQPVFFPENATNPAVAQRLPGGRWWLPTPADGNRIDLGANYFAYRLRDFRGSSLALWTSKPGRVKLMMVNPKAALFATVDGSDPLIKSVKGGIEVTLTEFPLMITGTEEVPVPAGTMSDLVDHFGQLLMAADAIRRDTTEERLYFSDGMGGFDRNPGGSLALMQDQYNKLAQKLARYTWIEAESSKQTNFSDILANPGCSNGNALSLRTTLSPDASGYYASYDVPVRFKEEQEVWIAARIPPELRGAVQFLVGGQILQVTGDPISLYGGGFGWYKLGSTRLGGTMTKLRIQVNSPSGADISIDTILLSPTPFTPAGVTRPDPIPFAMRPIKKT